MKAIIKPIQISTDLSNPAVNIPISLTFALVIALSARLSFMLPLNPVPVTLQTAAILLAGFLLGPRWGFVSVISYIAMGIMGAPVFAMGVSGPGIFFSPAFGYILAFPIVAWLVGFLSHRAAISVLTGFLISLAGLLVLFLVGMLWLAGFNLIGGSSWFEAIKVAWLLGVVPFIWIDLLKGMLAAGIWCTWGFLKK